jgi:arginine-tRNA-protein transferase
MMHLNKKTGGSKDCGYCKGKKEDPGSATWGIGTARLSTADYELMMNYGWRRCGTYVYKYDLEQSCCQPYTIRLDVGEFKISKS